MDELKNVVESNDSAEKFGGKADRFPEKLFQLALAHPNRVCEVLYRHHPLSLENQANCAIRRSFYGTALSGILDLKLGDLHERLAQQKLKLELADDARDLILKKGYDPASGARPLSRAIERLLTRPISTKIVEDAFQPGDTVLASADGERLKFEAKVKQG